MYKHGHICFFPLFISVSFLGNGFDCTNNASFSVSVFVHIGDSVLFMFDDLECRGDYMFD